jgi:hypothetical protein
LEALDGAIEKLFLVGADLFAPTEQGGSGFATGEDQGEAAQRGLGRLRGDGAPGRAGG